MRASSMNMSRNSGWAASSGSGRLITTGVREPSASRRWAANTSAMPPAPSRLMIWNRFGNARRVSSGAPKSG